MENKVGLSAPWETYVREVTRLFGVLAEIRAREEEHYG